MLPFLSEVLASDASYLRRYVNLMRCLDYLRTRILYLIALLHTLTSSPISVVGGRASASPTPCLSITSLTIPALG